MITKDEILKIHSDVYPTKGRSEREFIKRVKNLSSVQLTDSEKEICKIYLEDLDKNHTCNEYKLLMSLLGFSEDNSEDNTKCIDDKDQIEGQMTVFDFLGDDKKIDKSIQKGVGK